MAVVDGEDGVEDIIFSDNITAFRNGVIAGRCENMGICLEQGTEPHEEICFIKGDTEELETFEACQEETHKRTPRVVMVFDGTIGAFEDGGFCK